MNDMGCKWTREDLQREKLGLLSERQTVHIWHNFHSETSNKFFFLYGSIANGAEFHHSFQKKLSYHAFTLSIHWNSEKVQKKSFFTQKFVSLYHAVKKKWYLFSLLNDFFNRSAFFFNSNIQMIIQYF